MTLDFEEFLLIIERLLSKLARGFSKVNKAFRIIDTAQKFNVFEKWVKRTTPLPFSFYQNNLSDKERLNMDC